ncbi:zinc transporter ZIP3-like [Musca autumnalis]|uniref:zinc transporter ZIP3-like n=1 Tax=Musca autumnalis TaxID=221902 RepID=UPI003CEBAE6F
MDEARDASSDQHDLLVTKCLAMVCLFLATVIFGCIPFMLNCCLKFTEKPPESRSARVVQYLLYFGGGVLLATTFIHLLPEVQEVVEHLQTCGQMGETNFAVAETFMCAGFFLMYLIEECVHKFLHRHKKSDHESDAEDDDSVAAAFERGHSIRNSVLVKGRRKKSEDYVAEDNVAGTITIKSVEVMGNGNANGSYENPSYLQSTLTVNHLVGDQGCEKHSDLQLEPTKSPCSTPKHHHDNQVGDHQHHDHGGHGHSHLPIQSSNDNENVVSSSLRGLGIVLALSLHEVFEGLAIGLEDSSSSVWFLFAAVSAHKLVLAFCVGVELIVARTKPVLAAVYTITFAIVSPIGVAIGIAVSHDSSTSEDSIPSAVLQGIACGTLLYVVFFEILNKNHAGFGAFLAMLIGFGLMFGLQNIGEGHDHEHEECPGAAVTTTATTLLDLTTKFSL